MKNKINLFVITLTLLLSNGLVFSQIQSGKVEPSNEQQMIKPKKEKPIREKKYHLKDSDSSDNTFLFFGGGMFFSNSINQATDNLFSKPLTLEKEEKGIITPYTGISYKIGLAKGFYVSFGLDYAKSGEQYSWKSTTSDSSYAYKNRYQLVSIPMGINYLVGKKIQFIGGLGFAPNLTFGSKQILNTITEDKNDVTTTIPLRDKVNDFNIAGYVQAGVQFKIISGFYFYVLPEFRYSFFNTLNKQASYARKYWLLGGQAGFSISF
jgi:hypothetical protein